MIALRTGAFFAVALAVGRRAAVARRMGRSCAASCAAARRRRGLPGVVRHGIANLYRPGNQAQAAVVALGVGVMFTLAVFLVQQALVAADPRQRAARHAQRVPAGYSAGSERTALSDLHRPQPGVKAAPDVAFAVAARITAIDGVADRGSRRGDFDRRFLRTRSVTAMTRDAATKRRSWTARGGSPATATPQVCVNEETRPGPQPQARRH